MQGKYAYASEKELEEDIHYFLKKMRWTREQLDEYLKRPEKPHELYGSEVWMYNKLKQIYKLLRKYK